MAAEESGAVTLRSFSAYGLPLEMFTSFKYLGRVLLVADDEWLTVVQNVVKVQTVWWIMSKILVRKVERPRISRFFFKSLIQYHHGGPDMPMPEVYYHGGPRHRLATTPLNCAIPWT